MRRNKYKNKQKPIVHSYELLSKIPNGIDYKNCLRNHIAIGSDSDSDSSGESDFNDDYYKNKPPPLNLMGSTPNLLNSNVETTEWNTRRNTITIESKSTELSSLSVQNSTNQCVKLGAVPKNYQNESTVLTHSVSEANLNISPKKSKKKSKKAKRKANLTSEASEHSVSELNLNATHKESKSEENLQKKKGKSVSELNIHSAPRPIWLKVKSVSELNLNAALMSESKLIVKKKISNNNLLSTPLASWHNLQDNVENNLETPQTFTEVNSRKPNKRTHSSTSLSTPEMSPESVRELSTYPFIPNTMNDQFKNLANFYQMSTNVTRCSKEVEQQNIYSPIKAPLRLSTSVNVNNLGLLEHTYIKIMEEKAAACLRRNLSLDFCSFINSNLQGNESVDRFLETQALNQNFCKMAQSSKQQVDCKPTVVQQKITKSAKKSSRKARARLRKNLSLDFSSFINLHGNQSVETLLETEALLVNFSETEQPVEPLTADSGEDRFVKAYEIIGRILSESHIIENGRRWEVSDFVLGMETPHKFLQLDTFIRFLECSNNIRDEEKAEIGKLLYHKLVETSNLLEEESKEHLQQSNHKLNEKEGVDQFRDNLQQRDNNLKEEAKQTLQQRDDDLSEEEKVKQNLPQSDENLIEEEKVKQNLSPSNKNVSVEEKISQNLQQSDENLSEEEKVKPNLQQSDDNLSDSENYTVLKRSNEFPCQLSGESSCEDVTVKKYMASSDDLTPYLYSVESKLHMDRHLRGFDSFSKNLMTSPQFCHVDVNRVSKCNNFYRNYVEKYTSCEFQTEIFQTSYKTIVDFLADDL